MGWVNTPQLFQSRILEEILKPAKIYGRERNGCLQWIDDSLIYSQTFNDYLEILDRFLKAVANKKVRLNIRKCELINKEVEWCGRLVTYKKWGFHPKFFKKILEVNLPQYEHEIAQVIYLANWLSPCIPRLAELRDRFSDYTNLKGKTLKKIQKENKLVKWSESLVESWDELIRAIKYASEKFLHNYQPSEALLMFTDASKDFWALIIMQTTYNKLE